MKKFKTFDITVPVVVTDNKGYVDREEDRNIKVALPMCAIFPIDFEKEVQRYIDNATADYFDWKSTQLYNQNEKKPNEVTASNCEMYFTWSEELKHTSRTIVPSLSYMFAYCLSKHVQTYYYFEGKKACKLPSVIGNIGEEMYDRFIEAGKDTMTEEQAVELTHMVRDWFARIIACDEACKAWDTKNIKRDTVMQLVHEAGTIKERLGKQGITGKRFGLAEFTKQALLKCMKDNIKFVPAEQVTIVQRAHFIELPELPKQEQADTKKPEQEQADTKTTKTKTKTTKTAQIIKKLEQADTKTK